MAIRNVTLTDREVGMLLASLLEQRNRANHTASEVGPPWKDYWRKRAKSAGSLINKLRASRKQVGVPQLEGE